MVGLNEVLKQIEDLMVYPGFKPPIEAEETKIYYTQGAQDALLAIHSWVQSEIDMSRPGTIRHGVYAPRKD